MLIFHLSEFTVSIFYNATQQWSVNVFLAVSRQKTFAAILYDTKAAIYFFTETYGCTQLLCNVYLTDGTISLENFSKKKKKSFIYPCAKGMGSL